MRPVLNEDAYVYCSVPAATDVSALQVFAMIRETEGITVVLREAAALAAGLPVLFRAAWITLELQSDLAAIGFTAGFARALGDAGISSHVIAGAYHDHIFVPHEQAQAALRTLQRLAAG
jgi:hypothetical protein